jgi:hypothetical protein
MESDTVGPWWIEFWWEIYSNGRWVPSEIGHDGNVYPREDNGGRGRSEFMDVEEALRALEHVDPNRLRYRITNGTIHIPWKLVA